MENETVKTALSYWKAEMAKDLATVLDHFSSDATFEAPGIRLKGREEIQSFYQGIIGNYASFNIKAVHQIPCDRNAAIEFHFTYTRMNGESGEAFGCNVFTVKNRKITRLRAYFNPADY